MSITDLKDEECPRCENTALTRLAVTTKPVVTGDDELAEDTIWVCKCEACGYVFGLLYKREVARRYFKNN